jgi:hypothetical protein
LVVSEVKMLFHLLYFWWCVKWRYYFTCYIFGGEWSEDVISLVIFLVVSEVKMWFYLLYFWWWVKWRCY